MARNRWKFLANSLKQEQNYFTVKKYKIVNIRRSLLPINLFFNFYFFLFQSVLYFFGCKRLFHSRTQCTFVSSGRMYTKNQIRNLLLKDEQTYRWIDKSNYRVVSLLKNIPKPTLSLRLWWQQFYSYSNLIWL